VIVTPDGRHLAGLEHAFMESPGVRLSQIVQEDVDELQVNIVRGATFSPTDVTRIDAGLRRFVGESMRIRFNFVETIAAGRNGKLQFVVSRPGQAASSRQPGGRH
jgi:hypothetical protein